MSSALEVYFCDESARKSAQGILISRGWDLEKVLAMSDYVLWREYTLCFPNHDPEEI